MPPNLAVLRQFLNQNAIRFAKLFYGRKLLPIRVALDSDILVVIKQFCPKDVVAHLALVGGILKGK